MPSIVNHKLAVFVNKAKVVKVLKLLVFVTQLVQSLDNSKFR